jgi:hypothetical protein
LATQTSQAFKHVFTSPSSVDQAPKATQQGNAKLHNMTKVNIASLAYIATQVSLIAFPPTLLPFYQINLNIT